MHNKIAEYSTIPLKKTLGFTLIELMMVVAIIGILTAIAFPSYTSYVLRGKRAEGRSFLTNAAALQERYYSDCNKYGTLAGTRACATSIAGIGTTSETNKYTLSITTMGTGNQSYVMAATPAFTDPDCATLTITQAGTKGFTGTGSTEVCWEK